MAISNQKQHNSLSQQEDIVNQLLKEVFKLGYITGYHDGYDEGVEDTTSKYKSLMSDALRAGLSSGGRSMQDLKNYSRLERG